MARTSKRIRREWASLSAIAGAAVAASGGSAYATTVFHHGPNLTLPIFLPGGGMIALSDLPAGGSFTDYASNPGFRVSEWTFGGVQLLLLVGPSFTPAQRGKVFGQDDPTRVLGVAAKTSKQIGFRAFAFMTRSNQTIAAVKARVTLFSPFHYIGPYTNFLQRRSGYFSSSGRPTGFYESVTKSRSREFFGFGADQYVDFRFDVDGQSDYGWLEYDITNQQHGPPQFQLIAYAYNTDGEPLPAGFVPEPRNLPLALGALSLGAIGVREWRKSRPKSANT